MARSAERAPAEQRSDEIEERRGAERRYVMHQGLGARGARPARSGATMARSAESAPGEERSDETEERSAATRQEERSDDASRASDYITHT